MPKYYKRKYFITLLKKLNLDFNNFINAKSLTFIVNFFNKSINFFTEKLSTLFASIALYCQIHQTEVKKKIFRWISQSYLLTQFLRT